jgi:Family of unknown function (DUF6624)
MRVSLVLILILAGASIVVVNRAQQADESYAVKDRVLQAELVRMGAEDQLYRREMQVEVMKMSSLGTTQQSDQLIAIVKKQDEIDKRNMARLEEIIRQHGWPGRSLVGEEAANAGFLILQHADLTLQKKYFPLVKEGASKGEVRPADAAMLEDRILMGAGKKQIYGSAVQSGPQTGGKLALHPIEDEEHVDERRAAVGLMPIVEYLREFGLEYKRPTKR